MVIFFTNTALQVGSDFKHSEFLQLFDTISTAMCVRNRILNYNKMLNAI